MKRILIVEDNPADSYLLEAAFHEISADFSRTVVRDGVEAMEYLLKQGAYTNAPDPDAVILDLNMPRMDGRELIREIRKNSSLSHIPILVFSGSSSKDEMEQLKAEGIAHTFVKPSDLDAYFSQVRTFVRILAEC
ncbi:MAG: response regulator [Methanobacteriota archaeon]|nr:MAG: response regulator [Euryarchaeota archaeon]